VSTLAHRRLETAALAALLAAEPIEAVALGEQHRRALAERFQGVVGSAHRRLDAWAVECAGRLASPFAWTPARARRAIGRGALARVRADASLTATAAVRDEIDELFVRAAAGYARAGSLAHWLAGERAPVVALCAAEAVAWATTAIEIIEPLEHSWTVCAADAYYDVAAARTSLRAARDLVLTTAAGRTVVRRRRGQPGRSAGPGLRADLVIDALADVEGRLARRYVGLWPDAGILLSVDGTIENARAGARDLVRTAVAQQRNARARVA
jgi:hypothetical protein